MKDRFLFDTSALYPVLNYIDEIDVSRVHILSLTFYEVGNVIWREFSVRKKIVDPISLAKLFQKIHEGAQSVGRPSIR
ncbi:hypothetical protein IC006_2525 [Sulfuracidifex tepidarius]|uniref:PIN domain-containing protein n=1 Tax=Sulfuracidifex tepidarius TaxID=1294262 RepID=A0A510E621_9CREN|nr:hypothetical protein IC006_2525 [Sulfuracidifex tepidarius]BBG27983.1 hypothetical protein IC007_2538 [Sulfuracidifex tepidarius]